MCETVATAVTNKWHHDNYDRNECRVEATTKRDNWHGTTGWEICSSRNERSVSFWYSFTSVERIEIISRRFRSNLQRGLVDFVGIGSLLFFVDSLCIKMKSRLWTESEKRFVLCLSIKMSFRFFFIGFDQPNTWFVTRSARLWFSFQFSFICESVNDVDTI